jgi:TolB-like protein
MSMENPIRTALAAITLFLLAACSTIDVAPAPRLDKNAKWAVLPLANHTETPGAGARAAAVLDGVLRAHGFADLSRAPVSLAADSLFEAAEANTASQDKAMAWARAAGVRYALAGSVTEWRYKVGVDGEPAVGLTLHVIDMTSGATLWSATGARSGWSREALAAVAQKLARDLTAPLAR